MKSKGKRKTSGFIDRLAGLTGAVVSYKPSVTVSGGSEAVFDGCRQVIGYEPDFISVACDRLVMEVRGENLVMRTYSGERISVHGTVTSVEFKELPR